MKLHETLFGLLVLSSAIFRTTEAQQQTSFENCVDSIAAGVVYDFNFGNKVTPSTVYQVLKNVQKNYPEGINNYCFGLGSIAGETIRNNYKISHHNENKTVACDDGFEFYTSCTGVDCNFGRVILRKDLCSGPLYENDSITVKPTTTTSTKIKTKTFSFTEETNYPKPTTTDCEEEGESEAPEETLVVKSSGYSLQSRNKIVEIATAFSITLLSMLS